MSIRIQIRFITLVFLIILPQFISGQDSESTYNKLFDDRDKVSSEIREVLYHLAGNPGAEIGGEKIHNIEYLVNLYHQAGFHPFWSRQEYAQDALLGIMQSEDDGLLPDDYHINAIGELMEQMNPGGKNFGINLPNAGELDVLITDGVLFYAHHLLYGKTDQATLVPTWNFEYSPIPGLNAGSFRKNIENGEIRARLDSLRPQIFLYDTLLATLSVYRQYEAEGGWLPILAGSKIEPGDEDARVPAIRHRLRLSGESVSIDTTASTVYDPVLEAAIRRFQALHGLDPDGIIGKGTIRELNVPVEDRIETIRVNLERIRWVARNLPESYLIVNIAAFNLMLIIDGSVIHNARVMVGKTATETPIFRDKMRYIEFNPTWTVPTSIKNKEIIPHLKKDSSYLEKNHMVLLDSKGNEVDISTVDMGTIAPGNFPYVVRQQPGPWNSLGDVKFMFPNKHDIYLHDTPSKSLFSRASRAYSHGCIRVEKPLDLAEMLLKGSEWNREKIDQTIQSRQTIRVSLIPPPDVLIMYWTCGLTNNREIFFVPDIYERDKPVLRELNKPFD